MNKQMFFDYIVPRVSLYLSDLGFSYKRSRGLFSKLIDDGWVHINFSFYQFALTDNFNVGFELRKNSVQDILFKYIDQNPKNHTTSPTIVISLTSLFNQNDTKFSFNGEIELDDLLKSKVIPFIRDTVPVFVDRYNNLNNVYDLITDPREPNNYVVFKNYNNLITALIIGRLVFPNDFESVVKKCEDLFIEIKRKTPNNYSVELYEQNFDNIVKDLKGT